MMNLWQLKIFCKVIELKSFSKAGDEVHISQPTVSSHIKDLEDHFNCRLVDRLTREVIPTKAGTLLYEYALKLIALQNETESAVSRFKEEIKGTLKIGGSTIPGTYLLPMHIGNFRRIYPDTRIFLDIGGTDQIVQATLTGAVEAAIVGAVYPHKQIVQEKIYRDRMMLIIPFDHKWAGRKKIDIDTLLQEPFILRESGSGTRTSIRESLSEKGVSIDQLNQVAVMGTTQAIIEGIRHGLGVSILSAIAVSDEIKQKRFSALDIEGINLERNFYLTYHKYRAFSPLCNSFIGFIKKSL